MISFSVFAIFNLFLPSLLLWEGQVIIAISFYFTSLALTVLLRDIYFKVRVGLPFVVVYTFFKLFFLIAPVFQLIENSIYLVNTLPVDQVQILKANILTSMFLLTFRFFYFMGKPKIGRLFFYVSNKNLERVFPALVFFSTLAGLLAFANIADTYLLIIKSADSDIVSLEHIFKVKVIFLIPFLTLGVYLVRSSKKNTLLLVFLITLVLMTKNPLFDRRNAIGPVYLALAFIIYPSLISTPRRTLGSLMFVLVIIFPTISASTHYFFAGVDVDFPIYKLVLQEVMGHFRDLHYDAWASFVSVLDFTEKRGFSLGTQALGVLLFFIPRELWPDKPVSTGQKLGEYLLENHGLWFTNISTAYLAEGYINFGIIGLFIFSMILAKWVAYLDMEALSGSTLAKLTSLYCGCFLFFILRGSLLPAFAYLIGALLTLKLFPWLLLKFWHSTASIIRGNTSRE